MGNQIKTAKMSNLQRFRADGLIPSPPGDLNDYGLAEWNRVCSIYVETNTLTEIDQSMLYAYCNEWGKYLYFEKELKEAGRIAKAPSGYLIVHPYESMSKKALMAAVEIGKHFGMTPLSRGKLKTGGRKGAVKQFVLD